MGLGVPNQPMARESIPTLDLRKYTNGDEESRAAFVNEVGEALEDIGFFALAGHGIPLPDIDDAYAVSETFFNLDESIKMRAACLKKGYLVN